MATNWERLYSTPEKAAREMARNMNCILCPLSDICEDFDEFRENLSCVDKLTIWLNADITFDSNELEEVCMKG